MVDNYQVRGAGSVDLRPDPALLWQIARRGVGHALIFPDQGGALAQVGRLDQPLYRHLHKIAVCQIGIAVGKGEAARFGDEMYGLGRAGFQRREVKVLQHAEDLQDSHPARCGRRHAADLVAAIATAECLPLLCFVRFQVFQGKQPGVVGCSLDGCDDVLCDRAPVEGVGTAFRDPAQRLRIGWIL